MIITIVRKPIQGSVCENTTLHNCGGLNIEHTRVGTTGGRTNKGGYQNTFVGGKVEYGNGKGVDSDHTPKGRFPSNVLISQNGAIAIDEQSGESVSTGGRIGNAQGVYANQGKGGWKKEFEKGDGGYGDTGGASRYFKIVTEE